MSAPTSMDLIFAYPLYGKLSFAGGLLLSAGVFSFMSFRFNPDRWFWQFPLCLLLLVVSFLLIAGGVYALA